MQSLFRVGRKPLVGAKTRFYEGILKKGVMPVTKGGRNLSDIGNPFHWVRRLTRKGIYREGDRYRYFFCWSEI